MRGELTELVRIFPDPFGGQHCIAEPGLEEFQTLFDLRPVGVLGEPVYFPKKLSTGLEENGAEEFDRLLPQVAECGVGIPECARVGAAGEPGGGSGGGRVEPLAPDEGFLDRLFEKRLKEDLLAAGDDRRQEPGEVRG